jgi:hypothetical protein
LDNATDFWFAIWQGDEGPGAIRVLTNPAFAIEIHKSFPECAKQCPRLLLG